MKPLAKFGVSVANNSQFTNHDSRLNFPSFAIHLMKAPDHPTLRSARVRRWLGHLWREWTIETRRPIVPAFAKPEPSKWNDAQVTAAWIGHATVLINFFGVKILTDPVLFPRIGIRLPGFTIGPKRLTAPALEFHELPRIDIVLLSHAHFDHLDLRTLRHFDENTSVITAPDMRDLLRWTRLRDITEVRWGERKTLIFFFQAEDGIRDLYVTGVQTCALPI